MKERKTFRFSTTTVGALAALLFCLCGSSHAAPQDVSQSPPGASACLGCHGAGETELPSLKALSALDIETAMDAFRTGARDATLMNRIAKGFTPEESRAIAQWLTTQGRAP
jgi:hypothetical protein